MLPKGYLIGRLSSDPIGAETKNAKNYTKFSVACQDIYKSPSGEEAKAIFLNCIVWGKTAEFVLKNIKKGDKVFIEFSLNIRSYTNAEGKMIKSTELTAFTVNILAKKNVRPDSEPYSSIPSESEDIAPSISLDEIFYDK